MRYEWGPWIEHDGSGCPVVGRFVQMELLNRITGAPAHYTILSERLAQGVVRSSPGNTRGNSWDWRRGNRVIRYRVRRPLVSEWLAETTSDLPVTEDA
jgi:hypothetical protein